MQWGQKFKGYELWFNEVKLFEYLGFITNTTLCWGFHDTELVGYDLQVRRREDKVADFTRPCLTCRN
jgi:hypothetical protein